MVVTDARALARRRVLAAWAWAWLAVAGPSGGGADAQEVRPAADVPVALERLKAHVEILASPEFGGRRGAGARKAESYVVEAFRGAGLEPLFDGRYTQDVTDAEGTGVYGRNVGAKVVGEDPKLRDEWVVVGAHYDHLGVSGGKLYPGADDNASGVAMLIEVARALTESPTRPRRSVMFVAFDLEEVGLWGSRHFVEHPPVPMKSVVLNLTADMIGRSLGGVCDPFVFVLGTESGRGLVRLVDEAAGPCAEAARPLKVGTIGADVLVLPRSDYGPFRSRKVPFLFFSTGENPRYHRPEDTPDTLDYPKLAEISRLIQRLLRSALMAEALPAWAETPEYPPAEPSVMREVLQTLLHHREALKIGPIPQSMMTTTIRTLDEAIERGAMTPAERVRMLRAAQIILMSVLGI